ncbi:MAG: transcriptional repressor LexA [Gammaproteobacteria bacterium]|nr:transcriptional repressor LexA [Gammaproteobacteria bacterium]
MLTATQHKVLDYIRRYLATRAYAPSLDEIAAGIGIRSKGTAHRHVQALAEAGYLRLIPGRKRGIELVDEPREKLLKLPLLGRIAAGRPIEAIADQESLNLADYLLGPDRYALQVKGDSMIEAGILDGDMVIVKRQETANDNEIVVALIDGQEATLKRLQHRPDGDILLIAENPSMPPLAYTAERVSIQGVLVGQLRRY